jgi:hypothetical protein
MSLVHFSIKILVLTTIIKKKGKSIGEETGDESTLQWFHKERKKKIHVSFRYQEKHFINTKYSELRDTIIGSSHKPTYNSNFIGYLRKLKTSICFIKKLKTCNQQPKKDLTACITLHR